jgi:hypothetical protein
MSEGNHLTPPIASALVIGVGGSGIHTLSRLRAAVRDSSRPGVVAIDNVKFFGIDAVEQNAQLPPLPPGTGLGPDEFFDIAASPINAFEYVREAWQHDEALRNSWDSNYVAPNQPLTDGMKRSRPLGNLVFRVQGDKVGSALRRCIDSVVALNPDKYTQGSQSSVARIPVFIVASCAGGTGSSGFLHVLHGVHRAASAAGVSLAVYPVIFLPDVFASARVNSLNPEMEARAHWSNAYAFLSELDYVISEDGAFDELVGPGDGATTVRAIDVVQNIFLIDGKMTDGSQIGQRDAYDLAAAGLHALLVTESSSLLGAAGTNTDNQGFDALEPPQRTAYATMGSMRVVFPGSTFRRYARARLRAHLLQSYLLDDSASTNETERGDRIIKGLVDGIWGLRTSFEEKARGLRSVQDLLSRASNAASELEDRDVAQAVNDHVTAVTSDGAMAADELVSVLPAQTAFAVEQIPGVIDGVLKSSGEGLKVLRYAVKKAQTTLSGRAESASETNQSARQLLSSLSQPDRDGSLGDHTRRVQQAANRNFLVRKGELAESVEGYSGAVKQYADKLLRSHLAQAELDVARAAVDELDLVAQALESSEKLLKELRHEADEEWQNDDLEGKDYGGRALMALVPGDVWGQVDESSIAKAIWARIEDSLSKNSALRRDPGTGYGGASARGNEWVRGLYETWWKRGAGQGVRGLVSFGMGSVDAVAQTRSAETLSLILDHEVDVLSHLESVIPRDLTAAALLADAVQGGDVLAADPENILGGDESRKLQTALEETLKRADAVALQIKRERVKLQGAGSSVPEPMVQVIATGQMLERVHTMLPGAKPMDSNDPEIVATLAVQRGFPISAVGGLDQWHRAYKRVKRDRELYLKKSIDPPPYLDRRLEEAASSRPLVRRLYDDAEIAELIVQAMSILRVVRNEPELAQSVGLLSPIQLRWKGDLTERVGVALQIQNGKIRPTGEEVVLGTTAAGVFDRLAASTGLQEGISAVFGYLLMKGHQTESQGDGRVLEALSREVDAYRLSSSGQAEKLPTQNPTDEAERERVVRQAIDLAAQIVLAKVQAPAKPAEPPIDLL